MGHQQHTKIKMHTTRCLYAWLEPKYQRHHPHHPIIRILFLIISIIAYQPSIKIRVFNNVTLINGVSDLIYIAIISSQPLGQIHALVPDSFLHENIVRWSAALRSQPQIRALVPDSFLHENTVQ